MNIFLRHEPVLVRVVALMSVFAILLGIRPTSFLSADTHVENITLEVRVLPNPVGEDKYKEYVAIRNNGNQSFDFNEWQVVAESGEKLTFSGVLPAGNTYYWCRNASTTLNGGIVCDATLPSGFNLVNTGGFVHVVSPVDTIVSNLVWEKVSESDVPLSDTYTDVIVAPEITLDELEQDIYTTGENIELKGIFSAKVADNYMVEFQMYDNDGCIGDGRVFKNNTVSSPSGSEYQYTYIDSMQAPMSVQQYSVRAYLYEVDAKETVAVSSCQSFAVTERADPVSSSSPSTSPPLLPSTSSSTPPEEDMSEPFIINETASTAPAIIVSENTKSLTRYGSKRIHTQASQGEVLGIETIATSSSCGRYLLEYMKKGSVTNPWEVKKLQLFLNAQGIDTPITGVFDALTDASVRAYQTRESNDILKPWVTAGFMEQAEATGYVYKTTRWKINNTVCSQSEQYPEIKI